MSAMLKLYFVISLISLCSAGAIKPIKKCKLPDPECVRESAQEVLKNYFSKGVPEYRISQLEPYYVDSLDVSSQNLKMFLKNVKVTGFSTCKVMRMNLDNLVISGSSLCDLKMVADYTVDGKLLFLPIKGNGKIYTNLNNAQVNADANVIIVTGKDGKQHYKLTSFTHSYELLEKSYIKMTNLFDGNEALSRALNELFDTNPNDVIKEMGEPMVKTLAKLSADNVNRLFRAVPIEDLQIV